VLNRELVFSESMSLRMLAKRLHEVSSIVLRVKLSKQPGFSSVLCWRVLVR